MVKGKFLQWRYFLLVPEAKRWSNFWWFFFLCSNSQVWGSYLKVFLAEVVRFLLRWDFWLFWASDFCKVRSRSFSNCMLLRFLCFFFRFLLNPQFQTLIMNILARSFAFTRTNKEIFFRIVIHQADFAFPFLARVQVIVGGDDLFELLRVKRFKSTLYWRRSSFDCFWFILSLSSMTRNSILPMRITSFY